MGVALTSKALLLTSKVMAIGTDAGIDLRTGGKRMDNALSLEGEIVSIHSPIMLCPTIVLLWSTEQKVANSHWDNRECDNVCVLVPDTEFDTSLLSSRETASTVLSI